MLAVFTLFYLTKVRLNNEELLTGDSLVGAVSKKSINSDQIKQVEILDGIITQDDLSNEKLEDWFGATEIFNVSESVSIEDSNISKRSFFSIDLFYP